jgi:hypothetical protein
MALRPIREDERALIKHLLSLVKGGSRYQIPEEVANLTEGGMGGIQLATRGEHTADIVEADYKDTDGRDVLITLTMNQYDELFDLDIWKADFSSLQRYPTPDKVKLSV